MEQPHLKVQQKFQTPPNNWHRRSTMYWEKIVVAQPQLTRFKTASLNFTFESPNLKQVLTDSSRWTFGSGSNFLDLLWRCWEKMLNIIFFRPSPWSWLGFVLPRLTSVPSAIDFDASSRALPVRPAKLIAAQIRQTVTAEKSFCLAGNVVVSGGPRVRFKKVLIAFLTLQ